jgi:1,4-alpha-glucan branching enzyme
MPGDDWQRFANLRVLFAFMWAYPGKKLLFMGDEFGQVNEWNHESSLDWHLLDRGPYHRGVQRLVADLNRAYRATAALHEVDFEPAGFQWMDCNDSEQSVIAFARFGRDPRDLLLCVCNFTPVPRRGYRVGVPVGGFYAEVLNSDARVYGGSNLGNAGGVMSEPRRWHGQSHSVMLTLPPLGAIWLRPER